MKRNIIVIICSIMLLASTMAFAKDKFSFQVFYRGYEYKIKLSGAFTKPAEVDPGEAIIFYHAESIKHPLDLWSAGDYLFVGRTGENTYQIRQDFGSIKKTMNCYFDKNNPSEMELELPIIYVPNPNKEHFKLRVIDLKGNKLVYQIIVPEYLKPYLSK